MGDRLRRARRGAHFFGLLIAAFAVGLAIPAHAQVPNLLGLYIGGGAGQSHIRSDLNTLSNVSGFVEHHTAWKAFIGIRPISLIGAEIEYADLGHPDSTTATQTTSISVRGASAFGLLYLPLPVPLLDIYGKAGYSRLRTETDVTVSGVAPFNASVDNNRFAYGAGAQVTIGKLGVRADWERFDVPHGNPDLWTLNLIIKI